MQFHSIMGNIFSQVHKMSGHGVDSSADNTLCRCTQTRQLIGGNISKVLSRAALFSFASDTDCLYAAAGDEASNSVWRRDLLSSILV